VTAPLLDAQGAADLLNVPKSWVLSEARAGRVPHIKLGKYTRFDADDLLAWARARRRGPLARTRRGPKVDATTERPGGAEDAPGPDHGGGLHDQ